MLPIVNKPPLTRKQKNMALAVAMAVDFVQLPGFMIFGEGLLSPFQDALDVITAVVLLAICGFKWQFALGFVTELVPVMNLFPTWTAVVLSLPVEGAAGPEAARRETEARQRVNVRVETPGAAGGGYRSTRREDVVDVEAVSVPPVQGPPVQG